MKEMTKGNSKLIKELNLAIVLDLIRMEQPISRTDIAKRTRLSNPAVSTIINRLLTEELVQEVGKAPSQGGRRAQLLQLNSRAGFVLGLDVGGTKIAGGVVDLAGNILSKHTVAMNSREESLESLLGVINHLLAPSNRPHGRCWGIGLGVPGAVDPTQAVIQFSPGVGWDNIDIKKVLEKEFSLPIWIENDVNGFVRGEHRYGNLQGVQNGIGVTIGTGIGVGLLLNNKVYHGQHGAAGEIGYWLLGSKGPVRRSDGYGPLEEYAAGPGIARRAQLAVEAREQMGSVLLGLAGGDCSKITAELVFKAAELGDPLSETIVSDTIQLLGIMMANLASLLDVERIVVGGGVSRAGEVLLNGIGEIVKNLAPYPPEMVVSLLQEDAGILGAAAGVLESNVFFDWLSEI